MANDVSQVDINDLLRKAATEAARLAGVQFAVDAGFTVEGEGDKVTVPPA